MLGEIVRYGKFIVVIKPYHTIDYFDTRDGDWKFRGGHRFEFSIGKKYIGSWNIIISKDWLQTNNLAVEEKGKGYGQRIVLFVLRYAYKNFGARKVRTMISEDKRVTENFVPVRNLLLKLGYKLEVVVFSPSTTKKPFYVLELDEESYRKLLKNKIEKSEREILEKNWNEQIVVARKRNTER